MRIMRRYALPIFAAALTAFASGASAQEANSEPGYCAQFYPNADCNSGPSVMARTTQSSAKPPSAPHKNRAHRTATAK
jgi:hypothetical protein